MNKESSTPAQPEAGHYRSLQILDELSNNDAMTQRDLSQKLGIALGLVNSYIKNLVAKGFITVRNIPSRRYAYYLTPKGFAEKTRLAYDMLHDYTRIYREAKNNYRKLFHELEQQGVKKIVFAGSDEVAEIAYITLQDSHLELVHVIDDRPQEQSFFGRSINKLETIKNIQYDVVLIVSYLKRNELHKQLIDLGVTEESVRSPLT